MKNTIKVALVTLFGAIGFTACTKSGTTKKIAPNTSISKMSYSMNGTSMSTDSCFYYYPRLTDTAYLEVIGWKGTNPQVTINIMRNHGIGTYTLSGDGYAELKPSAAASTDPSNGGTVTITSTYPNFVGTFSFTTSSGVTITGGSFTAVRK